MFVPIICPLKCWIDIENGSDVVEQLMVNYLPDLKFCFLFWHWNQRYRIRGYLTAMFNLAAAVAAVYQGEELEGGQAMAPGGDFPVALVFGLGS